MSGLGSDECGCVIVQEGGNSRRGKASVVASILNLARLPGGDSRLRDTDQEIGGSKVKDSGYGGVSDPHGLPTV